MGFIIMVSICGYTEYGNFQKWKGPTRTKDNTVNRLNMSIGFIVIERLKKSVTKLRDYWFSSVRKDLFRTVLYLRWKLK